MKLRARCYSDPGTPHRQTGPRQQAPGKAPRGILKKPGDSRAGQGRIQKTPGHVKNVSGGVSNLSVGVNKMYGAVTKTTSAGNEMTVGVNKLSACVNDGSDGVSKVSRSVGMASVGGIKMSRGVRKLSDHVNNAPVRVTSARRKVSSPAAPTPALTYHDDDVFDEACPFTRSQSLRVRSRSQPSDLEGLNLPLKFRLTAQFWRSQSLQDEGLPEPGTAYRRGTAKSVPNSLHKETSQSQKPTNPPQWCPRVRKQLFSPEVRSNAVSNANWCRAA